MVGALGWLACGQRIAGDDHEPVSVATPPTQTGLRGVTVADSLSPLASNPALGHEPVEEGSEYEIEEPGDGVRIIY